MSISINGSTGIQTPALTATGAVSAGTSVSALSSIGYPSGAGGTVTQLTDKSTAVTLNKPSGQIITHNAALAAGAYIQFALNSSSIALTDILILTPFWGATNPLSYRLESVGLGNGTAYIRITNITGGSLSEAIQINFAVIKSAIS